MVLDSVPGEGTSEMKGLQVGEAGNATGHLSDEATIGEVEVQVREPAEPLESVAWQRDPQEVVVCKAKEAKRREREEVGAEVTGYGEIGEVQ